MYTFRGHTPITPSDATALNLQGLYAGGAGNVTCLDKDGTSAVYAVIAGTTIYTSITKVMATGTTATLLVGLIA